MFIEEDTRARTQGKAEAQKGGVHPGSAAKTILYSEPLFRRRGSRSYGKREREITMRDHSK